MVDGCDLCDAWEADGFVVLRGVVSPDEAARLRRTCDHASDRWREKEAHFGRSVADDACASMRHVNHPAYFGGRPHEYRELAERIADLRHPASQILQREPTYFCTTYWFNPRAFSRSGGWHRDTQFTAASDGEERAALRAPRRVEMHLQLALVPSDDVELVPGSHRRWDTPAELAIRKGTAPGSWESDRMPGAVRIALDAGDALAFNPYTIHRGRYLVERLRRTLMVSFSTDTAPLVHDYFTHQPWLRGASVLDQLVPETRAFYERFVRRHSPMWVDGERFTPT